MYIKYNNMEGDNYMKKITQMNSKKGIIILSMLVALLVLSGCVTNSTDLTPDELCNNIDDDLDGVTDDFTEKCFTGTDAKRNVGICKDGERTCKQGEWSQCINSVEPSEEFCNDSLDNDCDGKTDEKECCSAKFDGIEVCDKKDNNCNGQIDESCYDLKGYYSFDKNSDIGSINKLDEVKTVSGKRGQAIEFDGNAGSVIITKSESLNDIFDDGGTLRFWLKPYSTGSLDYGRVLHKGSIQIWTRAQSEGVISLMFAHQFDGGGGEWYTTRVLSVNKWNQVIIQYNNNSATNNPKIFINGELIKLTQNSNPEGKRVSDGNKDLILGNRLQMDRPMHGIIDELMILK